MIRRLVRVIPFSLVVGSVFQLGGCASADGAAEATGSDGEALASATTTFVVPVDARVRLSCRDEINRAYCDAASAKRAAAACVARIGATALGDACTRGSDACLRFETVAERCVTSAPVYPTAASCTRPRAKSCHFYSACLETSAPCGDDGYALGYGERYCYAFKNARFSAKGEAWRDNVMSCLQNALVPELTSSEPRACGALTDFAFASHPACYTERGHSICFLPPSDLAAVFGTIGGDEILKGRTLAQMGSVVFTCARQLAGRLFFGERAGATTSPQSRSIGLGSAPAAEPEEALSADELRASYGFWSAKADELGVTVTPAR